MAEGPAPDRAESPVRAAGTIAPYTAPAFTDPDGGVRSPSAGPAPSTMEDLVRRWPYAAMRLVRVSARPS
ncbi:MAG TPA: hypothetical protein VFM55_07385 [Micromonosporaceae bacterium]|nr:hypothetical protein [Micromonosporaceae bacterium]